MRNRRPLNGEQLDIAAGDATTDPRDTLSPRTLRGTGTLHRLEPDYTGEPLVLSAARLDRFRYRLGRLYGIAAAAGAMAELERVLRAYWAYKPQELRAADRALDRRERFTQEDQVLITYGDLVHKRGEAPLATLARVLEGTLGWINTVHLLPFFPYSSDRGFAVVDFDTVDPHLGSWEDIAVLEQSHQLMFDGVINHVSAKSRWFQEFLAGNPRYREFFLSYRSPDELTLEQRRLIVRPRTSDVLSRFEAIDGPRWVWTTFSPDQPDLNFRNPDVLLRIVEVLLHYVRRGADLIRLDAVTYLWDEPGTTCASLEETHEIVKLFRDVLEAVAPRVAIITETNVPHAENVSYFGDGSDEAHLVYNFALPPLVLHTFYTGDATRLLDWIESLHMPSDATHFLNFLDSHDGIGLRGAHEILDKREIDALIHRALAHGAEVSYRTDRDGNASPYEINVTWFSALNPDDGTEALDLQIRRTLASRSIQLALKGVPAMYLLGLIGKRNDIDAVRETGSARAINRTILDYDRLVRCFVDPDSKISRIRALGRHGAVRATERAFHPAGAQRVLRLMPEVVALLRTSPDSGRVVVALTSVVAGSLRVVLPLSDVAPASEWVDLLSRRSFAADRERLVLDLGPYEVLWLVPAAQIPPAG